MINIEGGGATNTWTKSSGVTQGSDGSYTFAGGAQIDYIRIPYGTSPYPIGEDMEIRMNAVVYSQNTGNGNSLYLIGKWLQVAGQGEFCFQRYNDGTVRLSIGSISESVYQSTSGSNNIALNTPFDFFWQRKGSAFLCKLNGNTIYSNTFATQRKCNVDWVLGSYLTSSGTIVGTQFATMGNWKINSLSITHGTTV
ncbi:hypothetical protein [Burkholderia phage FLC8]|nr:hypothetical protein [Burkholderia phage FLC8]